MKLFAVLFVLCLLTLGMRYQPSRPKWEYKIEGGVAEKKLNTLADEGWEVVGAGNMGSLSAAPYIILRREK